MEDKLQEYRAAVERMLELADELGIIVASKLERRCHRCGSPINRPHKGGRPMIYCSFRCMASARQAKFRERRRVLPQS